MDTGIQFQLLNIMPFKLKHRLMSLLRKEQYFFCHLVLIASGLNGNMRLKQLPTQLTEYISIGKQKN